MDFRPRSRARDLPKPRLIDIELSEVDADVTHVERMRSRQFPNRRRVVIAD
jgi:hypothetical protein